MLHALSNEKAPAYCRGFELAGEERRSVPRSVPGDDRAAPLIVDGYPQHVFDEPLALGDRGGGEEAGEVDGGYRRAAEVHMKIFDADIPVAEWLCEASAGGPTDLGLAPASAKGNSVAVEATGRTGKADGALDFAVGKTAVARDA